MGKVHLSIGSGFNCQGFNCQSLYNMVKQGGSILNLYLYQSVSGSLLSKPSLETHLPHYMRQPSSAYLRVSRFSSGQRSEIVQEPRKPAR